MRFPSVFLAALAVAATSASQSAQASAPMPEATAIVGVRLISMEDERVRDDQTIVLRGDRIAAVGPRTTTRIPPGARVVAGAGRYVIPGLYDMYAHVDETTLPLFVAHGVTTVRNTMPGLPRHLALRDGVARGELVGPRLFTTGPPLAGSAPYYATVEPLTSPAQARQLVADHRASGYDGIAVYTDIEPLVYRAVVDAAKAAGLPVSGHFPHKVPADLFWIAGQQRSKDNLLGEIDLRSGQAWVPREELPAYARRTAENGLWTIPTLTIHKRRAAQEPASELSKRAEFAGTAPRLVRHWLGSEGRAYAVPGYEYTGAPALVGALRDAGARLLLGSDAGYPFVAHGRSSLEELANLVEAGLSPFEALAAATRNAAEFLGELDRAGTIAVGKRADLLLLLENPLVSVENVAKVDGVVLSGRHLSRTDLDRLLVNQEAALSPVGDRFPASSLWPPPRALGAARFEVVLRGAVVAEERIARIERAPGAQALRSESVVDPHVPTRTVFEVETGPDGEVLSATVERQVERHRQDVTARRTAADSVEIAAELGFGLDRTFGLELPPAGLITAPHLAVNLDADMVVSLQLLVDRAVDLEVGESIALNALRIELNFEESGEHAIAGEADFVVLRVASFTGALGADSAPSFRIFGQGLNGSGSNSCDVTLADDSLIASANCGAVEFRRRSEAAFASAIDHHVHLMSEALVADWRAMGARFSRPDAAYTSPERVLGESSATAFPPIHRAVLVPMGHLYGHQEFRQGLALSLADERSRVARENDHVARQAARFPGRAVALCSVPALRAYALEELSRCRHELASAGVKLHLASSEVDLRDESHLDRIGEIATWAEARGMPLLLHLDTQLRGTEVRDVERFAERVLKSRPRLTVVVAHLGGSGGYGPWTRSVFLALGGWLDRSAAAGEPRENVFFDLSAVILEEESEGVPATTPSEVAQLAADLRASGLRRLVFGSDYPVFDPRRVASVLSDRVGLSVEEVAGLLARSPFFDPRVALREGDN